MNSIIKKIFSENDFEEKKIKNFSLFEHKAENKKCFYILMDSNPDEVLDCQSEIYEECRKELSDKTFDKNCTMIILYQIADSQNLNHIKEDVLKAEEDPYIFKKQVLYYEKKHSQSLKVDLGSVADYTAYISEMIADTVYFKKYKENHKTSKEALVFRIFSKLPFLSVQTENGGDLESLFTKNNEVLVERNLDSFDETLFYLIKDLEVNDIKGIELLSKLDEMNTEG